MGKSGVRDPVSHRTPEQIRKQVRGYNARPENVKKRQMRNEARDMMRKKHGESAIAGKDVGHKKMVSKGGTNAPSNLRIEDRSKNRGWNKK